VKIRMFVVGILFLLLVFGIAYADSSKDVQIATAYAVRGVANERSLTGETIYNGTPNKLDITLASFVADVDTASFTSYVEQGDYLRVGRTSTSSYKIKKVRNDTCLELYTAFAEATAADSVFTIYRLPNPTNRVTIAPLSDTVYIYERAFIGTTTNLYRLVSGESLELYIDLSVVDLWMHSDTDNDSIMVQTIMENKY